MRTISLMPRLIVRGADAALEFYRAVFDARVEERYADDAGHVVHATFSVGGSLFALADEKEEWNNLSPASLGGSPVLLSLVVDDADAFGERLRKHGATEIFPIEDQFYGHREGRFRDPFGHSWIVTQVIAKLTPEEIQARMRGDSSSSSRAPAE